MLFGTQLDSRPFVDEHFHRASLYAAIAGSKAQISRTPECLVNTKMDLDLWPDRPVSRIVPDALHLAALAAALLDLNWRVRLNRL